MFLLIFGLVVFLGIHSTRIVADGWRGRVIARIGEGPWKLVYSLVSVASFVMVVWGFSVARQAPTLLWSPPLWSRHLAALLTVPAFVFLVAAYVPGNAIKATLKHPMVLGVKLWALAHLLANSTTADAVLFGGFLLWSVLCFRAARQRDRSNGVVQARGRLGPTLATVTVGLLAWAGFAFWAHGVLIGVRPFG